MTKKTLVVYYSRTGTTKRVAESISKILQCDIEEIVDAKDRKGMLGYILSGRDAIHKKLAEIKPVRTDLEQYENIIMGTPIWASTISSPIRTFIYQYKNYFKNVAFFSTQAGEVNESIFKEMEELSGKKPIAQLGLRTKEVVKDKFISKAEDFVSKVSK